MFLLLNRKQEHLVCQAMETLDGENKGKVTKGNTLINYTELKDLISV